MMEREADAQHVGHRRTKEKSESSGVRVVPVRTGIRSNVVDVNSFFPSPKDVIGKNPISIIGPIEVVCRTQLFGNEALGFVKGVECPIVIFRIDSFWEVL